jgi:DNA-binding LacI/PurR family transcriptional regulator
MASTLRDVAERAGVSISTVSRVLNDRPGVGAATRERVLQAASELAYTANVSARGLATDRTRSVGIVGYRRRPHLSADLVPICDVGMDDLLRQRGYHMLPARISKDMMTNKASLPMLDERRVDGLIVCGPELISRFIIQLHSAGLPLVLIDNMLEETRVDCVLSDNEPGTYEITKHLLTVHGHKQIAFLSGPTEWLSSRERYAGYVRALTEHGLEPHRVVMTDTTIETGQDAMREALDHVPGLTAVVGVNDATAWGAGRACREAGLSVPEDIAIVGYDDVGWARLHEPPLTTVAANFYEIGYQAASRLIQLIDRKDSPPMRIRVATELVIRGSYGCNTG